MPLAPMAPDEIERLRTLVDGPAACPSCGIRVPRDRDTCDCDECEVDVEPFSREFLVGPPFADRDTIARLLMLIPPQEAD